VVEVDFSKYLGFGMQELDIQIEGEFLIRFLEFIDVITKSPVFNRKEEKITLETYEDEEGGEEQQDAEQSEEEQAERVLRRESRGSAKLEVQPKKETEKKKGAQFVGLTLFRPTQKSLESRMLYFAVFHLNPISLLVSFRPTSGIESDLALAKILNFSGSMSTIENARVRLKYTS
jgi:hypothetical protein